MKWKFICMLSWWCLPDDSFCCGVVDLTSQKGENFTKRTMCYARVHAPDYLLLFSSYFIILWSCWSSREEGCWSVWMVTPGQEIDCGVSGERNVNKYGSLEVMNVNHQARQVTVHPVGLVGLGVCFLLMVQEVSGCNPAHVQIFYF